MPAALKTPLLEPNFTPDNPASNWNSPAAPAKAASQASARAAAASVSGAALGSSARAASRGAASARSSAPAPSTPVRTPSPEREEERREEHGISARPVRSRPEARTERSAEAAVARMPRSERRHRRFRPTLMATLCGCALMGQLVLLLWLHGKTLSSARQVEKMDAQIAEVSNHIERTQERIAAFDSSPQIKQWAQQKGWKPATHLDFDDITTADEARAAAQAEAQAAPAPKGEVDAR